jgi:hypothetical protein
MTLRQTAVASCHYDWLHSWRRAMEHALYILPILNFLRLSSVQAPVCRLLCAAHPHKRLEYVGCNVCMPLVE